VEEHRAITEMIRAKDTEGAMAALTRHFDEALVTLQRRGGEVEDQAEDEKTG
jgi:DNA-binding GntR family transcriptional regulator